MAGEQEIRGTKNLGLVQAIYAGINPPMNTKIIWYDDSVGVKIHKYYDVTISEWVPFGFNGQLTINGTFTYISFSSNCDGSDFSLIFDEQIHTHTAIIVSDNPIPQNSLIPELFENKWIKLCNNDGIIGGNYTYIAFADDDTGSNFSLSPFEIIIQPNCELIDGFIPLNNDYLNDNNQLNYTINNVNNGINIDFDIPTSSIIEIDLKNQNLSLQNNQDYFIEVQIPNTLNCDLFVKLDENEIGGYFIDHTSVNKIFKFLKNNQSSKLLIEFITNSSTNFIDEIFVKIGTASCYNDGEIIECKKYRSCFALINSDTPLSEEELTPQLFENKWYCNCKCNNSGDISNIMSLINSLFNQLNNFQNFMYIEIESLIELINNLSQNTDNSITLINQTIQQLQLDLQQNFNDIQQNFNDINNYISSNEDNITNINNQIQDILNQISNITTGSGNISEGEKVKIILDTIDLQLMWKKGSIKYNKQPEEITAGVTDNIYTRNGFISFTPPSITMSDTLVNNDNFLWEVDDIMNLVFKFDKNKFDQILKYNPKIQIHRYRDTVYKGYENPQYTGNINNPHWRHAGYKMSKNYLKYKPNIIPITKHFQVIDIGQEHYFRTTEEYSQNQTSIKKFSARGLGNRFRSLLGQIDNTTGKRAHKKAWVWLEFRLEIDYANQVLVSKPLARTKMILTVSSSNTQLQGVLNYQNCIKFKNL